jgi:hypothetical protein
MRRLALALLLSTGCSQSVGYSLVHGREYEDVASGVLDEAADMLGVQLHPSRWGPLYIELVTQGLGESVAGRHRGIRPCIRIIRSSLNPIVVAHELGHALGLDHHDDPSNIMYPYVSRSNTDLDDDQQDKIERGIRRLSACP